MTTHNVCLIVNLQKIFWYRPLLLFKKQTKKIPQTHKNNHNKNTQFDEKKYK